MHALILVDLQNDFLPGGALGVPDGDGVIIAANALSAGFDLVVATQDWHPPGHSSFLSTGPAGTPVGIWPAHCVAGTPGAEFAAELDLRRVAAIFRKGSDPRFDSYSGFFDVAQRPTGLGGYLRSRDIIAVTVVGLATDYCVRATALDAVALGFAVTVDAGACRAVNVQPGDGDRALDALAAQGVRIIPA